MVEVQFIGRTALYTTAFVSAPHLQFHIRRDDSAPIGIGDWWKGEILVTYDGDEAKAEHIAFPIGLDPSIDKVKNTVVGPDAIFDFLVDPDSLRRARTMLVGQGRLLELAVFSRSARWKIAKLIEGFWICNAHHPRLVVAFIDQDSSVLFNTILIWRIWPY